jgi:glucosamine-6-phosphate deaminase
MPRVFLNKKKSNQVDTSEIRAIKGLIRRCEARATCRYGHQRSECAFPGSSFYETGTIEKNPMGEEDIKITIDILRKKTSPGILCGRPGRSPWNP